MKVILWYTIFHFHRSLLIGENKTPSITAISIFLVIPMVTNCYHRTKNTDSLHIKLIIRDMIMIYSKMHCTDKYSQHNSIIWPVRLNGWVLVYELSGCGFGSCCSHSVFWLEKIFFHVKWKFIVAVRNFSQWRNALTYWSWFNAHLNFDSLYCLEI